MNKSQIFAAFLVALGLLSIGLCLRSGIGIFAQRDRFVSVRGLCEREVKANKVTWPIVTQDMGDNLVELYDRTQTINGKILAFLKNNGIEENEISVNAPDVSDRKADSYDQSSIRTRYSLTNVIVVTSSDIDKVNKLLQRQTELLKEGVAILASNYRYPITYEYTDLNAIKPQMIADATENARQAALKFSQDSGSQLGQIKTATQGQFSIYDRDQFTPYIKTVRVVTYIDYYLKN